MYELFTLGGGTYLVDLLNAVAAITGGDAYVTLAQLAGVAGLGWVLFRTAFGGSWKDNGKWIRRWTGRDGQPAEATEWHRIAVFGGAVEPVEKLVRKGAAVLVEGRLAVRDYTDAKGKERQVTEVVVAGPQGMVNVVSPKPKAAEPETAAADGTGGGVAI